MNYEHILYETEDNILTITLNRPDKLNAYTGTMQSELLDALDSADADDDVKAKTARKENVVLVIDDDNDARQLIERYLTREGMEVVSCGSGEEPLTFNTNLPLPTSTRKSTRGVTPLALLNW